MRTAMEFVSFPPWVSYNRTSQEDMQRGSDQTAI